jgi:starch synthase
MVRSAKKKARKAKRRPAAPRGRIARGATRLKKAARRRKAASKRATGAEPAGRAAPELLPPGGRINIVYAASEAAPFAKTGGLADVAGALPAVLAERGADVTVMLPLYRCVRESGVDLHPLDPPFVDVPLGPHSVKVGLEGAEVSDGNVRLVCLRYDPFFDRPELYGEGGRDYPDNSHRFALFSRGVISAAKALGLRPHVFHVNDWQTALVCAYVRTLESGWAAGARSLLTIHNIGYQGAFWKWDLPWTGLDWSLFTHEAVEYYDTVNYLKAGIVFADAVTTVSPTYARAIQESREYGMGMEGALTERGSDVHGILNGVDRGVWSPETDPHIASNYSSADLAGKAECKAELQKELGLPVRPRAPLLASIGRIAEQKGTGLIVRAADDILALEPECQIVVLGTGDSGIERALRRLEARLPGNVVARIVYDNGLAHRIEAGADVFLMPSLYEPCGLSQLYSMIYGTAPIVRATGGLADTVEDSRVPDEGTGFVFEEFAPRALVEAARRAFERYRDPKAWRSLMQRGMAGDWSWSSSAAEYEALYREMLARR